MLPTSITLGAMQSFTLAIILLFLGKSIIARTQFLYRYSIPEPVVGGFLCAAVVATLYFVFDTQVNFDLRVSDILLLYFFAGIGLKSDVRDLLKGGRPLLVLLALASVFIVLQNSVGMGMAALFGMTPSAGLMAGSVSLTGGYGTTLAWAPIFAERLGIANALEIGVASTTVGLIAACIIGGPIANYLIQRYSLAPSNDTDLTVGAMEVMQKLDPISYHDILWAWMWLNLALMLGNGVAELLAMTGLTFPPFVSCLLAGILIRNLGQLILRNTRFHAWSIESPALALVSELCLGMFLVMALMGLQLWQLGGYAGFILSTLSLQILLSVSFTVFILFHLLGRHYESSVMAAGFGGITLGSTATAIVNMSSVTQKYGAAHQAFIVVPLVCGFFIDLINALIIGLMSGV